MRNMLIAFCVALTFTGSACSRVGDRVIYVQPPDGWAVESTVGESITFMPHPSSSLEVPISESRLIINRFDGVTDPKTWIAARFVSGDPLIKSFLWRTENGFPVYEVDYQSVAVGGIRELFIFKDARAFSVALLPAEIVDAESTVTNVFGRQAQDSIMRTLTN